jgi:hypothetical protein
MNSLIQHFADEEARAQRQQLEEEGSKFPRTSAIGGFVPPAIADNRLTAVENKILQILLSRPGTVVSREELVRVALGRPFSPASRTLDVHVHRIRRKVQAERGVDCIKTVRGAGYVFVDQVGAAHSSPSVAPSAAP